MVLFVMVVGYPESISRTKTGGLFGLLPAIKPLKLLFVGEHGKGKGDGAY